MCVYRPKRGGFDWIGGLSIKKGIEGLEKTHNMSRLARLFETSLLGKGPEADG